MVIMLDVVNMLEAVAGAVWTHPMTSNSRSGHATRPWIKPQYDRARVDTEVQTVLGKGRMWCCDRRTITRYAWDKMWRYERETIENDEAAK